MLLKLITYFGQPMAVSCDANCGKAWGGSSRPKHYFSEDEDDYCYLTDGELGEAPADPGSYEGGVGKPEPNHPEERLNKWCVRECERCQHHVPGEALVELKPWAPVPNMPKRRL